MTDVLRPAPRPVTPLGLVVANLKLIQQRMETLGIADPMLENQVRHAVELAGGLDPYLDECTSPESPALARLARQTQVEDWAARSAQAGYVLEQEMLSGHVEGRLLRMLVRLSRAQRVLEIGMFTGYSALAMAEALPPDGVLVACERDPSVADVARQCFAASPSGGQIRIKIGPAARSLAELVATSDRFDLIFIDADKAGYRHYVDTILDGELLGPHGLIAVDNTLMQGQPYGAGQLSDNGRAIADFNRSIVEDSRVEQVLLPLRDGLTLIQRVENDSAL